MSNKIQLTGMEITTKTGEKIVVSVEEAKELYDQLHKLFGEKPVVSYPIYIEPYRWKYPNFPPTPMWTSDSGMSIEYKTSGDTIPAITK
jgi:hypothetical protein